MITIQQLKEKIALLNDEKMIVAGPMLIPNKKILRLKEDGSSYYVYFSPQTIEKLSRKFMKQKLTDQITLEHGNKTSGIYMIESWIVEHPTKDKSNLYGFTLPRGTWFALYSVADNPKVWERVKSGEFNGFSIEALLTHQKSDLKLALEKNIEDLTEEEAEIFLGQIKAIIRKDKRFKKKEKIEFEAYDDYPQSVRDAARIAREQNDKVGGKCMTLVGKRRSADLEAGRPVSRETIAGESSPFNVSIVTCLTSNSNKIPVLRNLLCLIFIKEIYLFINIKEILLF